MLSPDLTAAPSPLGSQGDKPVSGAHPVAAERRAAADACALIVRRLAEGRYAGHDPYDGLASALPAVQPLLRSRPGRLLLIQAVRRSPLDLRPWLRVPESVNPKTLALAMMSVSALYRATAYPDYSDLYCSIRDRVLGLTTAGFGGNCWGYPFPWQARSFYFPAGTPTVVCSSFVALALIDGYLTFGDQRDLRDAASVCDFILRDLNRTRSDHGTLLSYSPQDDSVIVNASALGARILYRVGRLDRQPHLIDLARSILDAVAAEQREDGSWIYGHAPHHRWVDNFHTGYVIEALADCNDAEQDRPYETTLRQALDFYFNHLTVDGWRPNSRPGSPAPTDTHTVAEALRIQVRFGKPAQASRLLGLALDLCAGDGTCDDIVLHESRARRVPAGYVRWSRAWLAYGLSALLPPGATP